MARHTAGQRSQLRVRGRDPDGSLVASAIELPDRWLDDRQMVLYQREARHRFRSKYPNAVITSVRKIAMGGQEESAS